jgi:hypothetical protein
MPPNVTPNKTGSITVAKGRSNSSAEWNKLVMTVQTDTVGCYLIRYLEHSNPQTQKLEWWSPAGRRQW